MRTAIRSWFSTFTLIAVLAHPSEVQAQQVQLTGEAKGSNEVPPLQSPASGKAVATYDPATRTLSWTITYSGLLTRPTAIHFHGPADSTRNAGIALLIGGNLDSPIKGSAVLTESQAADLLSSRWYLNIHTATHPAGELRAQMTR
jgi:hypothetical protein